MIIDPILEEKYNAQKRLDEKANHDIEQYFENCHYNVLETAKKYGFTLQYGEINGGFIEPLDEEFILNGESININELATVGAEM